MVQNSVKIALVDDSRVVRTVLSVLFESVDDIDIVASGENGRDAVSIVQEFSPDVLILDIEMPVMDGIETLKELKKIRHSTKIIILSTLTEKYAPVALKALSLGATTYIEKPSTLENGRTIDEIKEELLKLIRSLGRGEKTDKKSNFESATKTRSAENGRLLSLDQLGKREFDIVCIASSTGGPEALTQLVSHLDPPFSVPIVIVQHMPVAFLPHLAKRLNKNTALDVKMAEQDERLEAGTIYIAPGDIHTALIQKFNKPAIDLRDSPPEVFCKPSANPLFRTASTLFAEKTLCIVLTGMGEDGSDGAEYAVDKGATILAQDKATSTIWGMPYHIVDRKLHSAELSLDEIASLLNRINKRSVSF